MREITYNRTAAVAYARKWALARNPAYYDFEEIDRSLPTSLTKHVSCI